MSELKIIKRKPIVSWFNSGDPCSDTKWFLKITDINVILTKRLTDEFIHMCLVEKNKIFLHLNITGMGKTVFEPNIPTVRETFFQLKKLINLGFPQKQILVIIDPILPNENGLKALQLLLKLFTEYRDLRLRFIRFKVLTYTKIDNKYIIANRNIQKRFELKKLTPYLLNSEGFWKDYYNLINNYSSIVSIDKGEEALVGIRELLAFGFKNEFIDFDGTREKIIEYEDGNKYKPILNIISDKNPVRCENKCLLCKHAR